MLMFAITRLRRPHHHLLISLGAEQNKALAGIGSCVECDQSASVVLSKIRRIEGNRGIDAGAVCGTVSHRLSCALSGPMGMEVCNEYLSDSVWDASKDM